MNSKTNPIVLDIGCGVGHLTRKFLNFGYDIIGIDISQSAVQLGRKTLGLGERIQEGDLIKGLEFDDATFDFIVCFGVLQFSLEKLDTALYEIKRVTKNSGKVFVSLSLGNEFIGENYCSDFHQFIKFWEKYFIIEGIIFDESKFNEKQIEKIPKLGGDLTVFGGLQMPEKNLFIVHCIDTEGPLYEPMTETFKRINKKFQQFNALKKSSEKTSEF